MTPFMPRVLNARIASKHLRKVAPFASMLMECMICFITRTFQAEVTLTPVTLCSFDRRNYRFPMCTSLWAWYLPNLCAQHKNRPLLESRERYEALRNCRWVDEVLEDAPWVITPQLIEGLQIDYVAHDELPYAMATGGAASDDLYDWLKKAGKFLPTRRTEGISTSDLVARIVSMYCGGQLDAKLSKMGESELASSNTLRPSTNA